MTIQLIQGDCLQEMKTLEPQSVDCILTDLPYGTTACSWDVIIPFAPMWAQVKRALKPRGVFVTTASQPFTSKLVMSNLEWFKYEWIWIKKRPVGYLNSGKQPMRKTENICVFCEGQSIYNPQDLIRGIYHNSRPSKSNRGGGNSIYGSEREMGDSEFSNYPSDILQFDNDNHLTDHPTQKPVALYAYLIRTYTNEGDTVLDMCMGSGTTLMACVQTGRNGIGIELDESYFKISQARIAAAQLQVRMEI